MRLGATIALLHSPLVGPSTWRAVAERLSALGARVVVPDFTPVARAQPPLHPRIIAVRERFVAEVPRLPLSLLDEPFLGSSVWTNELPVGHVGPAVGAPSPPLEQRPHVARQCGVQQAG